MINQFGDNVRHEQTFTRTFAPLSVPVITSSPPLRPSQTQKSKRHLSSPSIPSPQEEKKIKSYTSPNRYAALAKVADGEIENEVFQPNDNIVSCELLSKTKITPMPTQIPAIYIKNVTNFSIFSKKIISLTGTNDISFKSTPSFLKIRPNNRIIYNIVIVPLKKKPMPNFTLFGRTANVNTKQ